MIVYVPPFETLGKEDSETAALTVPGSCRDAAAMQGDDLFTEAETDTGTVGFGGEERDENPFQYVGKDAFSVVLDDEDPLFSV